MWTLACAAVGWAVVFWSEVAESNPREESMTEYSDLSDTLFKQYSASFGNSREVHSEMFRLALQEGHFTGLHEVEYYYQNFLEIAKIAYVAGLTDASATDYDA